VLVPVGLLGALAVLWTLHPASPAQVPGAAWAAVLAAGLVVVWFAPWLVVGVPVDPVSIDAVARLAVRGARGVTAAAGAVLVSSVLSAPALLSTVSAPVDRIGARLEVALVGAGLLLSSRSCRHVAARAMVRLAGLACWVALASYAAPRLGFGAVIVALLSVVVVVPVVVPMVVVAGPVRRSARWARAAEVAESCCGASALAVVVVASGLFRHVWELTS
jgi:hypothetical protein